MEGVSAVKQSKRTGLLDPEQRHCALQNRFLYTKQHGVTSEDLHLQVLVC